MILYKQNIDMTPGRVPLEIHMKQYDTDFAIEFKLIDRKGELNLEAGTTAKIRGTKADGYGYSVDAALDIESKTVTVQGDEQMTIVAGKAPFELVILKGTKILNTATFYLKIWPAALSDDADMSESDLSDFRQAINAAAQASVSEQQAGTHAAAASGSAAAAESAAASAEQSAIDAANVFQVVGTAAFIVGPDGKVKLRFTKEEE